MEESIIITSFLNDETFSRQMAHACAGLPLRTPGLQPDMMKNKLQAMAEYGQYVSRHLSLICALNGTFGIGRIQNHKFDSKIIQILIGAPNWTFGIGCIKKHEFDLKI